MAVSIEYTDEQRKHQAERLGRIFGIENAGMKISRDGLRMEPWNGNVKVTVEVVEFISIEEAEKIMNAVPVEEETE